MTLKTKLIKLSAIAIMLTPSVNALAVAPSQVVQDNFEATKDLKDLNFHYKAEVETSGSKNENQNVKFTLQGELNSHVDPSDLKSALLKIGGTLIAKASTNSANTSYDVLVKDGYAYFKLSGTEYKKTPLELEQAQDQVRVPDPSAYADLYDKLFNVEEGDDSTTLSLKKDLDIDQLWTDYDMDAIVKNAIEDAKQEGRDTTELEKVLTKDFLKMVYSQGIEFKLEYDKTKKTLKDVDFEVTLKTEDLAKFVTSINTEGTPTHIKLDLNLDNINYNETLTQDNTQAPTVSE